MAKTSTFEKRLASLEKTITDFFTGGSAKKPAKKAKKKKSVKAKKKTAKRKRA
ncbi:MAG: hypothetical protein V4601_11505 [Pseudomonadota bacterium]